MQKNNELIEIIDFNGERIFTDSKKDIQYLKRYLLDTLPINQYLRYLFLDLHKVVDSLNEEELKGLKSNDTANIIVSFVGRKTKTRSTARANINRLLDNQIIDFGILVFTRGRKRSICTAEGSKYWIIQLIMLLMNPLRASFIDDGIDHVRSVLLLKDVQCFLYEGKDFLTYIK